MSDLRLLAWLRWRQWRGSALYWLRIAGYDPTRRSLADRLYVLYLLGFGALWLLIMGAWAFYQAAFYGSGLAASLVDAVLAGGMPWLALALSVIAMVFHARSAPLKLSFADMAFVAGSPMPRAAVVLVNYVQEVVQALVLLLPVLALVAAALAQPLGQAAGPWAALRAAAVAVPLVALALALAWCIGLLYLGAPRLKRLPLSWLLPVSLLACGYLLPGVFLWPGRTLAAAVSGPVPFASLAVVVALAGFAIGALASVGRRTNMVDVCDESAVFARINALGLMSWLAPDLAQRVRRQAALARRKPFLRLPVLRGAAGGPAALFARSALTFLRRPLSLPQLAAWGFFATLGGSGLVSANADMVVWLFGLTVLLLIPPPGLAGVFRSDVREPFLRQLLPAGNLTLLAADVSPALLLLVLGGLAAWLLQPRAAIVAAQGALLVVILTVIVALALGASEVVQVWGNRVPYAVWAGCAIGAAAVAGFATASLGIAAVVGGAGALLLALSIARSPWITAAQ